MEFHILTFAMWALVLIAIFIALLAAWRFFTLRSRGTTVILRHLPQNGVHGWRHGSFRYNGNDLEYYKLRSLSPMPDLIFNRLFMSVLERRELSHGEADFMSPGTKILQFKAKNDLYELGLDTHSEMAFTAWLEAAPDARTEHTLTPTDFVKNRNRNGTHHDR